MAGTTVRVRRGGGWLLAVAVGGGGGQFVICFVGKSAAGRGATERLLSTGTEV
jgi:hypothetical protein